VDGYDTGVETEGECGTRSNLYLKDIRILKDELQNARDENTRWQLESAEAKKSKAEEELKKRKNAMQEVEEEFKQKLKEQKVAYEKAASDLTVKMQKSKDKREKALKDAAERFENEKTAEAVRLRKELDEKLAAEKAKTEMQAKLDRLTSESTIEKLKNEASRAASSAAIERAQLELRTAEKEHTAAVAKIKADFQVREAVFETKREDERAEALRREELTRNDERAFADRRAADIKEFSDKNMEFASCVLWHKPNSQRRKG
jgi:hypothetical protein